MLIRHRSFNSPSSLNTIVLVTRQLNAAAVHCTRSPKLVRYMIFRTYSNFITIFEMMLVSETYSNLITNHKIYQLGTLAFVGRRFENRKYKFCMTKGCCSYKITYMTNYGVVCRVTNFILVSQTPLNSLI